VPGFPRFHIYGITMESVARRTDELKSRRQSKRRPGGSKGVWNIEERFDEERGGEKFAFAPEQEPGCCLWYIDCPGMS
jgi:hypothetical protein